MSACRVTAQNGSKPAASTRPTGLLWRSHRKPAISSVCAAYALGETMRPAMSVGTLSATPIATSKARLLLFRRDRDGECSIRHVAIDGVVLVGREPAAANRRNTGAVAGDQRVGKQDRRRLAGRGV